MRGLVLALSVLLFPTLATALCPPGTYDWVDTYGNKICKSFDTGATRSIAGTAGSCPIGMYPWVDTYGNKVCKSHESGQEFHGTSRGCQIGSHPGVDTYGNKICQRF